MYTKELGLQMSGQNRRICGIGTIEMKKKKNIHIFDTITNPIKIIAKRKEVISNIKKTTQLSYGVFSKPSPELTVGSYIACKLVKINTSYV